MKKREKMEILISEKKLEKAIELVRRNSKKIKEININDLLRQQKDLYFYEGQKVDSFLFEILVLLGVEVNDMTLYYAIDLGMLGLVKLLVENFGFDVNNRINRSWPLIVAVDASVATCTEEEMVKIVKFLISKGVNIHVSDNKAFKIATGKNLYKVLKVLLNADKSI